MRGAQLLILSGVAAFFLVFLAWWGIHSSQNISAQTAEGQVTTEGKIELTPTGDLNKNNEVDAGDTVALTFRIRNLTDTEYKFAQLITGVDGSLFYDIWNLQGAASLSEENGTISFPNIVLPPHSKQFITVETTIKYFTEGQQRIVLAPQLLDKNGNQIGTIIPNTHANRPIGLWVGELPDWVLGWQEPIASPSPTPEPTLEPSTTPTPETTPEITPSPSATPLITLEPGPTTTPTPDFSPAPSPSDTVLPTP